VELHRRFLIATSSEITQRKTRELPWMWNWGVHKSCGILRFFTTNESAISHGANVESE
jgi:hypothetical protein